MEQIRSWARDIEYVHSVPTDAIRQPVWRRGLVSDLRRLLGISRPRSSCGLINAKLIQSWHHHKLVVHRITVTQPGELPWEAVILEPSDTMEVPRPGWVCFHGHLGGGLSSVTQLAVDLAAGREVLQSYKDDYAFRLAQQGYVTINFDLPTLGSQGDEALSASLPTDHLLFSLLSLGRTYMGWCVENAVSALTVLQRWPGIDPSRIGVIGFNMGGRLAMFMAALDERVYAAVLSGMFNQERARLITGHMLNAAEVVPGLSTHMEDEDIMAAAAPKRLYVYQKMYNYSIQTRLSVLQKVYQDQLASDRLKIEYSDVRYGDNHFIGDSVYRWIEQTVPVVRGK